MAEPDKPDKDGFDTKAAELKLAAVTGDLVSMLKAKQEAQAAENVHTFVLRSIRAREPIILQLFDANATVDEILATLAGSDLPRKELRSALIQLRDRHRKRLAPSGKPSHGAADGAAARSGSKPLTGAKTPAKRAASANTTIPDLPDWADGSDKRSDETDEDYRLRKHLEGPPENKRRFIGENNS